MGEIIWNKINYFLNLNQAIWLLKVVQVDLLSKTMLHILLGLFGMYTELHKISALLVVTR
jgi:hypothetical protein